MIYIARGEHATAHYAICTGFMALGISLPAAWSGWLQQQLGYPHFFVWVILATVPSFIAALFIPLDAEFGKTHRLLLLVVVLIIEKKNRGRGGGRERGRFRIELL